MSSSFSDACLAGTTVCDNLTVLSSSCNKISQCMLWYGIKPSLLWDLFLDPLFSLSAFSQYHRISEWLRLEGINLIFNSSLSLKSCYLSKLLWLVFLFCRNKGGKHAVFYPTLKVGATFSGQRAVRGQRCLLDLVSLFIHFKKWWAESSFCERSLLSCKCYVNCYYSKLQLPVQEGCFFLSCIMGFWDLWR